MTGFAVYRATICPLARGNGICNRSGVEFGSVVSVAGAAVLMESVDSGLSADVMAVDTVQNETGGDSVVVSYVGVVHGSVAGRALDVSAVASRGDGVGYGCRIEIQGASTITMAGGASWM